MSKYMKRKDGVSGTGRLLKELKAEGGFDAVITKAKEEAFFDGFRAGALTMLAEMQRAYQARTR